MNHLLIAETEVYFLTKNLNLQAWEGAGGGVEPNLLNGPWPLLFFPSSPAVSDLKYPLATIIYCPPPPSTPHLQFELIEHMCKKARENIYVKKS
jgi:hypothetical protein